MHHNATRFVSPPYLNIDPHVHTSVDLQLKASARGWNDFWRRPLAEGYAKIFEMKSRKRLAYCSGWTVEISAPAPCFTVLAA